MARSREGVGVVFDRGRQLQALPVDLPVGGYRVALPADRRGHEAVVKARVYADIRCPGTTD